MSADGSTVNVPLLRKELEYVTAHRDRWEQSTWLRRVEGCGTVGCLAGNAVLHADGASNVVWNEFGPNAFSGEYVRVDRDGSTTSIRRRATELFGLTDEQGLRLFRSTNTLFGLWALASEFTNGEIQVPEDVLR